MKSLLFVSIQFMCLGYYVLSGNFLLLNSLLVAIQVVGMVILGWAVITMNPSQWTIFPEPKKLGFLIVSGPYRWIRHPMYSGLLLICLAIVIDRQAWLDLCVLILFTINLVLKLNYEESMLVKRFTEYAEYKKTTWRVLPWVY